MRVSIGSAGVLGLIEINQLVKPTTCYILFGDQCTNHCLFCSQNISSSALSRVEWPEFDEDLIIDRLNQSKSNISRVCLQCTSVSITSVLKFIEKIDKQIKTSVSYNFKDLEQISKIVGFVDKVCIPLDASNETLYQETKGQNFNEKLTLIFDAVKLYPEKITTHLIIGLGEKESDTIDLLKILHEKGITVGLFAFTPIKGTPLQNKSQPDIIYYRRMQVLSYLLNKKEKVNQDLIEKVVSDKLDKEDLGLIDSEAFMTSGCNHCNRPYYNESPRGIMFNYPRKLSNAEYKECINDLNMDKNESKINN